MIVRGDYAPGSTFPSEPELAEQYGLSRPTINRALLILRGEGLIRVERGRGSFVRAVPTIPRYANSRYARERRELDGARGAFDTEITRLGLEPRSDLVQVGRVAPPPEVAAALNLKNGEQALIRKRHMYAGDTPVQHATSYVPWTIAEGTQLEEADTGPGGTYSRLAELGHPVTPITEAVRVRPPTADEADLLNLSDEQHVLAIFHTPTPPTTRQSRSPSTCSRPTKGSCTTSGPRSRSAQAQRPPSEPHRDPPREAGGHMRSR